MTTHRISRRVALGAAWAAFAGALAACDTTVPKPDESTQELRGAASIREQVLRLEPHSYVKTYRVDAAGAGGAMKTFAEAYAAVTRDRAARIGTGAPGQSNPWDWRCIEVAPGEYHESIKGVPPHTAIVGMGGKPEDVHVWWDGDDNTFESTGRSTYVRNVHLDHTSLNPDAHAVRDNGPSGDVDLQTRQRRTVVYESVKFSSAKAASLGKCTADLAPRNGVSLTFHKCVFDGAGQPQSVNLITSQSEAPQASTFAFVGCEIISNHEQHPSAEWHQLGTVDAAPFGAPDFAGGRGDTVLWMDGRWDVGKVQGVQALMVFPLITAKAQTGVDSPRASTRYLVVEPGGVAGMKSVLTQKTSAPSATIPQDVKLPEHCLSDMEEKFYGQKPAAKTTLFPAAADDQVVEVAAGEVYWVALPERAVALFATDVTLASGKTQGAMIGSVAVEVDGKPISDANGRAAGSAGSKGSLTSHLSPRWFYPGQGRLWIAVTFSAPATVSAMKATAGGAFKGSGGGGQVPSSAALTPVPEGTLVPRLGVVSSLPASMS